MRPRHVRARSIAIIGCAVAVIVVPSLPAQAANPITFAPHVDYPTGVRPEAVVSADFNSDGKPDLATADRFDWEFSILLGAGAGTFAPRIGVLSGPEPTGVVAGDFNGDGKVDLAASINSAVSVLLGNGDGTFGTRSEYPSTSGAEALATADVNGDSKADLVTSRPTGVTVHLGTGTGAFGAPTDYAASGYSRGIVLHDLTGDDIIDIAVVGLSGNAVNVLPGQGAGAFGGAIAFPAGSQPIDVAAGDFNADGVVDLVTADYGSGTSSILLGLPGGAFGAPTSLPIGPEPFAVAVSDLDMDGDHDIAVSVAQAHHVAVFGNGDGTFTPATTLGTSTTPTDLIAADVNTDDRPDLVTTSRTSRAVSVLLNQTVPMTADIGVKLTAKPRLAILKPYLEFSLTITNSGPDPVRNGTVTSTIPQGLTGVAGPHCVAGAGKVTCNVGNLAVGASTTRKFTTPVSALTTGNFTITATRTASFPADPNASNDTSQATCLVVGVVLATCR
ncbi:conserved repeat domain-containing protein [Actinokineospora alba]|uniref:Conserved repeat domain-containing protein n=1 Tax=Actinokineospora alba TaxID=504798 RepID=A0A1H0GLG9_9PSEU|nr:FG-GAP-like repeat-containing protein [Actinokineospora alba]TDP69946.1 putative repeat protein (TIGR01451 family) [Actinokineospora alba]SDI05380.1 conserved repeat domain-containing protein [Actinokineospora alba]SDO07753.1 conserved repeat domain-containing protein [Actinokineospora alba]